MKMFDISFRNVIVDKRKYIVSYVENAFLRMFKFSSHVYNVM